MMAIRRNQRFSVNVPFSKNQSEKIKVGATIYPIYSILEEVGGEKIDAELLLPVGGSPHTFEITPKQVKNFKDAELLFAVGLGLDDWALGIKDTWKNLNVKPMNMHVALADFPKFDDDHHDGEDAHEGEEHSAEEECLEHGGTWDEKHGECEGISSSDCSEIGGEFNECASACRHDKDAQICTLQCVLVCEFHEEDHDDEDEHGHDHVHDGLDPHYWLSPENAKKMASYMAKELGKIDGENAAYYSANAEAFDLELSKKQKEWKTKLSNAKNKNILVFHNAWGYFSNEFDLSVVGVFEEAPGRTPGPAYLAHLSEETKEKNVDVVFVEPQLSEEAIKAFKTDLKLESAVLDPLGGVEGRRSYIDLMDFNVNSVYNSIR